MNNNKTKIEQVVRRVALMLMLTILSLTSKAQLNTDRVMNIGRNALYFEDYILAIQYFNQVIKVKPYMAEPYFLRGAAKLSLEDYKGAEEDCSICIEYNPFIIGAYHVRGVARQNLGDNRGAIEDYNKALEYMPEDKTFLLNKAIAQAEDKQTYEADSTYKKLIELHPNYYNAYMSRSQYRINASDTLGALADVERALEIDKYSSYGYAQRAMITFMLGEDKEKSLADMDKAIKIEPRVLPYYINRAVMRYHIDDLRGSMADYNYVVEQEPTNTLALYNRGLLRMQVGEYNDAIEDFTRLLNIRPNDIFAIYNRAMLYDRLAMYRKAVKDYTRVIDEYPDYAGVYFARSEALRKLGDLKGGKKDFDKAMQLEEKAKQQKAISDTLSQQQNEKVRRESDKSINKFDRLLVSDDTTIKTGYESTIRGRVQDNKYKLKIEPQFTLTYYEQPSELNLPKKYYKDLEDLNRARILPRSLKLTNHESSLDSLKIARHFASIADNTKLIDINPQNAIPYMSRAIDFMLIQDFNGAIEDLSRITSSSNDFIFAYFLRAVVRYKRIEYMLSSTSVEQTSGSHIGDNLLSAQTLNSRAISLEYEMVLRDYDKVISIDPTFPYSYYNRANIRCEQKDFKGAEEDYTKAIELNPDFAEAYFNRALVYTYIGNNEKAVADLSKAGELGMVQAYNVIKLISEN
ncbi:MAG: tetratricopeptide repeat protein [Bacteroidales bacterium]|nr:tetratricopeptide repeat protein [Bacteroidales bacterium]